MVRRSGRLPVGVALALGTATFSVSLTACGGPLSSSGSLTRGGSGTTPTRSSDRVIVCESGTSSRGGVETSSAVAVRVPKGAPVPPGCREG